MTERLQLLKHLIENEKYPVIQNSSTGSDESVFYWNDIETLGWATKSYTHDSSGEVDGWERWYAGPSAIRLSTSGKEKLEFINPNTLIN